MPVYHSHPHGLPNVTLSDEHARMVDALGEIGLEHLGLQPALQEILDLQRQHVIEPHAGLVQHANADETTNEGISLEEPLGIFVIELEELTSSTTDFGEDKTDAPDFALVAEAVLAGKLWTVRWLNRPTKLKSTLSSASRREETKGRRGTL